MPTTPMLTAPVPPEGGSAAGANPIGADEAISVLAALVGEVNRLRRNARTGIAADRRVTAFPDQALAGKSVDAAKSSCVSTAAKRSARAFWRGPTCTLDGGRARPVD